MGVVVGRRAELLEGHVRGHVRRARRHQALGARQSAGLAASEARPVLRTEAEVVHVLVVPVRNSTRLHHKEIWRKDHIIRFVFIEVKFIRFISVYIFSVVTNYCSIIILHVLRNYEGQQFF